MAKPIVEFTRGVPQNTRQWGDVFSNLTKFLRVQGDELQIEGGLALPPDSVGTPELEDQSVTNAKFRDSSATSVIGRSVATSGAPADIIAVADSTFLRRSAGSLSFGAIADSDLPATIARDSEVTAAVAAHEAASDPHPTYTTVAELTTAIGNHAAEADPHAVYPLAAGAETISGAWSFSAAPAVPSVTVATLPAATQAARIVYVSDESGGAVLAFSDGTNWRRVTDRAVVS